MPAWRDRFAADVARLAGKLVGAIVAAGSREIDAALARAKTDAAAQLLAALDQEPAKPPRAPKTPLPGRRKAKSRPAPSKPKITARPRVAAVPAPHDGSAASTGPDPLDSKPPPISSSRDRFAVIEAAATARRTIDVARAARRGPARGIRRALVAPRDLADADAGVMPVPTASFEI